MHFHSPRLILQPDLKDYVVIIYSLHKDSIVILYYLTQLGTGMPIQAASDKIKDEIKLYGCPPKLPETKKGEKQF